MQKTKTHIYKRLLLISVFGFIFIIIITNIISIYSIGADQFNIFHKYERVYRLETWNIPNNVDVDINNDGIDDRMAFTGCLTLSGTIEDKDIVNKQYDCDTGQSKGIRIFRIGKTSLPQIRLSYVGKSGKNWDIVLIRNLQTEVFNIDGQGNVISKNPSLSLQLDTIAYFISHLFVLITGM